MHVFHRVLYVTHLDLMDNPIHHPYVDVAPGSTSSGILWPFVSRHTSRESAEPVYVQ